MGESGANDAVSIGVLSRQSGVRVDTLRAWERRYRILTPERSVGGHRRYAAGDVRRVLWLASRVADGQRISDAVAALRFLDRDDRDAAHAGAVRSLVDAAISGDAAAVHDSLGAAFGLLPVTQVFDAVVFPALVELGERWAAGEMAIAAEHLLTAATVGWLARHTPPAGETGASSVVVFCPSGERHELGAMVIAYLLRQEGLTPVYLGADTPLVEAARLARHQNARAAIAVCTLPDTASDLIAELNHATITGTWLLAGPAFVDRTVDLPGVTVWGPRWEDAERAAAALATGEAATAT